MTPWIGAFLVAAGALAGWQGFGWRGLAVVASVTVFWLLLQFARTMRVMRAAGESPVGEVGSAVMLHSRLRAGMTLLEIVAMARSLGRKVSDAPEVFEWRDASGAVVEVQVARGRCMRHALRRAEGGPPAT